jgi:hypothetical protein
VIDVSGVEDDPRRLRELLEAKAGTQAISLAECIIEDHHIRPLATEFNCELFLARDGAEEAVAGLLVEQALESHTQGGMVVDDKHAYGIGRRN